jgi:hypothetical protein
MTSNVSGAQLLQTTPFDCVERQHDGAEKLREQIDDMTLEQELVFWRERSRILRQRQEAMRKVQQPQGEIEQTASSSSRTQ